MGLPSLGFLLTLFLISTTGRNVPDVAGSIGSDALSRQKRGLFPNTEEYKFFDNFFKDWKGSSDQFRQAIDSSGRIRNWGPLFGEENVGYPEAINRAKDFYRQQGIQGRNIDAKVHSMDKIIDERIVRSQRYGGPDRAHQRVIDSWRSARNALRAARVARPQHETVALLTPARTTSTVMSSVLSVMASIFGFVG